MRSARTANDSFAAPARRPRAAVAVEVIGLVLLPVTMPFAALWFPSQTAGIALGAAVVALLCMFVSYEWRRPALRETMPVVVLAALAAAGRIIFAPFGHVKPVSAVVILAGAVFGRQSGFMVGALAALVSNFFFGQGAWTPWQMFAWGFIGWLAGILAGRGVFAFKPAIYIYGFASGLLYGLIMNLWSFLGFYHPQSLAEALVVVAPAIPLDVTHGIATVAFLALLWAPWHKKLTRLKTAYGMDPTAAIARQGETQ